MKKLGKESMKSVSGGASTIFRDENGKKWYLLYSKGQMPKGINMNSLRDAGEDGCMTKFANNEGKILKEFESENGVVGLITDDLSLAKDYSDFYN